MSFGPEIRAKGRVVTTANVYTVFYNLVPGFDGLRVPARYSTIVALGLAAVWSGVAVMRAGKRGMGISVAGIVLGTVAVCSWILTKIYS